MQMKLLSGFTPSCIIHLDINNKWPLFDAVVGSDFLSRRIDGHRGKKAKKMEKFGLIFE